MGEDSETTGIFSFSNFNPLALLSMILFAVGLILASVSMGIGQWSQLDTDRVDKSVMNGATIKTQSLLSRCVSYELTREIVELGLTIENQPQSGCLSVSAVNCSVAGLPLVSSLDVFKHKELHNSDSENSCKQMKKNLQLSAGFVLLGIIASFLGMLLFFPLLHFGFFVGGAIMAISSVIFYAVGIGAFLNQGLDYAGFFSLDGVQIEGCLSYGFGIALAAVIVNILATLAGVLAICYKKLCPTRYKYDIKKSN